MWRDKVEAPNHLLYQQSLPATGEEAWAEIELFDHIMIKGQGEILNVPASQEHT